MMLKCCLPVQLSSNRDYPLFLWLVDMINETCLLNFCRRLTFETSLKLRGGPALVFAHSLGNNVFRYFLEWLKLEIAPKRYLRWLDDHIHAYFSVGMDICYP